VWETEYAPSKITEHGSWVAAQKLLEARDAP